MIYTPETMTLWPRLLHAARALDNDLADVLQDLMNTGASLTVSERGVLELKAGRLDQAAYDQVKRAKLLPKSGRMSTILNQAQSRQHPWITPLTTAYADLKTRCQKGETRLKEIIQKGDHSQIPAIATALQERYWQAISLAETLFRGGLPAYASEASSWVGPAIDLLGEMRRSGIPFDEKGVWPWPVQTPDGWLWVVDKSTWEERSVSVELGRERGTKMRLPEEPVIQDIVLGDALAPLEAGLRREAG